MKIRWLSNGLYSLNNCHENLGKCFAPPPLPFGAMPKFTRFFFGGASLRQPFLLQTFTNQNKKDIQNIMRNYKRQPCIIRFDSYQREKNTKNTKISLFTNVTFLDKWDGHLKRKQDCPVTFLNRPILKNITKREKCLPCRCHFSWHEPPRTQGMVVALPPASPTRNHEKNQPSTFWALTQNVQYFGLLNIDCIHTWMSSKI